MDVKCEKCQARYRIDDGRVGPAGLTMRCGKCGNTFKVTRGGGTQTVTPGAPSAPPAAAPAASKPPPAAAEGAGQTMMFGVAPVLPQKPAPAASKPAPAKPAPAAAKPLPQDGAGSTMMFGAPPVLPPKPAPVASKPAPAKPAPAAAKPAPQDGAGATMMFAGGPAVPAKPEAPKAPAKAAVEAEDDAGSTMMFAGGPAVTPASTPKVAPAAPQRAPEPAPAVHVEPDPLPPASEMQTEAGVPFQEPQDEPHEESHDEAHDEQQEEQQDEESAAPMGQEPEFDQGGVVAEGAESGEHTRDEPLVPQPRKIPVVPIAIGAALIVIALLALVMVKRFGKQAPLPAAIEQMADAHKSALKDTPAEYANAETSANAALAVNARAFFPVGYAELAEIEIAWADALHDKSAPESEVKARRQAASDALNRGAKQDPQNVDLMIAQADYYRSAGSTSSYSKAIKKASALAANDARVVFVQGMAMSTDEDAADKALPLLKQAAASLKDSARVHYRYAVALINAKQSADAVAELNEVIKLSPGHERAKALLEQETAKNAPPPPAQTPPPEPPKKKGK